MKIGIFLTGQHPPESDIVAELEGQYAMARLARDRGWDAVATGQHYLSDGVRQLQLIPFLARLAAEAGEMTGIAGVLLAGLHNPVEVAECIASLDAIWRGNFVFGVGLGYRDVEFDAFGLPRGQRVRRFEECLEVVRRLWTDDKVSFENSVCKLTNVTATCRPVQKPYPPIWIAANSDAAVRRAARLGDSLFINPHATMLVITGQMALYRAELARQGKPFPAVLPYLREIFCARDQRTAIEMAGPYLAEKYRTYAQWGQDQVLPGREIVPPIARRPAARPVCARRSRGMLRTAAAVLGAGRIEFSDLSNPLERHAGRPRARQHAADQRRVAAGVAAGRTRRRLRGRSAIGGMPADDARTQLGG